MANDLAVATEKGKGKAPSSSTNPPTSELSNLSFDPPRQSRTALRPPPPRPSDGTKPPMVSFRGSLTLDSGKRTNSDIDVDSDDDVNDAKEDDQDNPFGDQYAVTKGD